MYGRSDMCPENSKRLRMAPVTRSRGRGQLAAGYRVVVMVVV